jgi:hypothetical protein
MRGRSDLFARAKSVLDHYLRDAGGMNPLAVGEPILGIFWAAGKNPVTSPKSPNRDQVRVSRVVEIKSASWTRNIFSWMAKRAG